MSASGKSSNRRYEYGRGYEGGGHGVYAEQGRRDRQADDARKSVPRPIRWRRSR